MTFKQGKDAGTNFVSCQSRNMVFQFEKAYLQTPIKFLHFSTPAKIQNCLMQIQNILAFLTVNHLPANSRIIQKIFLRYSCSCYSSMVELLSLGFRSLLVVFLGWFLGILKQLYLVKTTERQFWNVSAISCWRCINIDVCKTSLKGQIREFEESY